GLMNNGGLSVLIGNRTQATASGSTEVSYTGSLVGSTDGKVMLSAGQDLHLTGSDVIGQRGVTLVGQNVTIDAAVGTSDTRYSQKMSQGGINVGLGGALADLATTTYADVQRGREVKDDRLKALYAAKTAYDTADLANAMQNGAGTLSQNGTDSGINLQVGIGGASASSTTTTHDETAYGSHLRSQGDVTVAATHGDLNVIGSAIAGDNVTLAASHDLNVLSQAEQHRLKSSNRNASGGVGLQIGTDGVGFYAQASVGGGKAHGNGTTHAESHIDATNRLSLVAGNDATLQGAQLTGNQVVAAIGHHLNVISEQDTDDYAS
ncbi:hemagglutinin repeat-containing protein, partial [Frateuria defendens]|uniref:hemagglutinin repeat-containing protein n=1 Tax=Frateuria defendens TaxID=2219559 RepID=UPI001929D79F